MTDHPDIEALMEKLCREIAKCDLNDSQQVEDMSDYFEDMLKRAIKKQNNLGNKARFRKVRQFQEDAEIADLVEVAMEYTDCLRATP